MLNWSYYFSLLKGGDQFVIERIPYCPDARSAAIAAGELRVVRKEGRSKLVCATHGTPVKDDCIGTWRGDRARQVKCIEEGCNNGFHYRDPA